MANSDKNIKITPNIGATSVPVIEFVGQGSQSMFLRVLDGSTASLAFEASEGQLFSITNNLSQGTIFSVNDISGIPFIELDASGTVSLNRFTGNTGIGTGLPTTKLEVAGTISGSNLFTNRITASSITSTNIIATTLTSSDIRVSGNISVSSITTSILTATNISNTTLTSSTASITTLTSSNINTTNLTASARITTTNIFTNILTASTNIFVGTGSATTPSIVAIDDSNTGLFFPTADTIAFVEGGAEAMRINSSGYVGIGTTVPDQRLVVQEASTSSNIGIGVYNSTPYGAGNDFGGVIRLGKRESVFQPMGEISGNPQDSTNSTEGELRFSTRSGGSTSNKMWIKANGNVGIGVSTPSTRFEVSGNISGSNLFTGRITASSSIQGTAFVSTVATGTPPLTVSSTTVVTNLNADLLDGQHGTYYLDYTNITNKPTISNVTINVNSGAGLTGSGSFTLNQTTTASITISHADTSTVADVATASGVFVSGLTFDTYGHVVSVSTASGAITSSSFGFLAVSGQTTVAATTPSDILTLVAGTNITLSTNNTNKSVTINASSGGTAASAFGVIAIAGQDTVSADDPGDTLTFVAGNGIILTSSATIDFVTIGTNGTSSNVSGAIVLRDTSGNFAATTVSANLFGTASNATALNGQTASYYLDWTNINNKPDPVITLSGDATGSVTLTDLNSGTLNLTITKDSSIILSGDLSGSAIMTDLGNVNISTIVLDDSHNHIMANIDDLQTTLDAKLSSSVYTAADVLSKILTVDGTGSTLDADLLDGQHGTYYLDYNNLNNKPIISNVSITVVGNAGLTGSGSFTLNQSTTASITVSHADTSNVGTITASSNIYLTGLGFDEFGHVLSATTGSVIITEPVGSKVYAYKNFGGAL